DAGLYRLVISNVFGSTTSAVATLTVIDPLITSQPASRTNAAGDTAFFNVMAIGSAPFGYQWFKDGQALTNGGKISGAFSESLIVNNALHADAGLYQVVVSNAWGTATSAIANLTVI